MVDPRISAVFTGVFGVLFLVVGIVNGGLLNLVGPAVMLVGSWMLWRVAPLPVVHPALLDDPVVRSYAVRTMRALGVFFAGILLLALPPWLAASGAPPWLVGLWAS